MNYDNWKLSNPIDDGCCYDMVSRCCGAEIVEGNISNCCGAIFYEPGYPENDICSSCNEHATEVEECE